MRDNQKQPIMHILAGGAGVCTLQGSAIWPPPYFSCPFPAEAVTALKAEPPVCLESRRVPAKRIYCCIHVMRTSKTYMQLAAILLECRIVILCFHSGPENKGHN
ncbi:hypothetical protein OUZ56_027890 [Daphnia magna]|uniref:Uncharacterized protein n=1 Tax=Daphnia magna TaxID=35525 RepID=A0ABR0B283_9CRUS|nr:hypothetical protein OUZ56_027890 [Daphnia magna]